jgi:hypothetical protein
MISRLAAPQLAHLSVIMCYAPLCDHARDIAVALEQFAEKALGGLLVTLGGHQNIQHVAKLAHCSPQILDLTIDLQENLSG